MRILWALVFWVALPVAAEPFNDQGEPFPESHPTAFPAYGIVGHWLDIGTTTAAVGFLGFQEGNPVGATPVGLAPIVIAKFASEVGAQIDPENCSQRLTLGRSASAAAGGWNIGLIAGQALGLAKTSALYLAGGVGAVVIGGAVYWFLIRDRVAAECPELVTMTVLEADAEATMAELYQPRVVARYGPPWKVVVSGWRSR